jgi:hypothetical protein
MKRGTVAERGWEERVGEGISIFFSKKKETLATSDGDAYMSGTPRSRF